VVHVIIQLVREENSQKRLQASEKCMRRIQPRGIYTVRDSGVGRAHHDSEHALSIQQLNLQTPAFVHARHLTLPLRARRSNSTPCTHHTRESVRPTTAKRALQAQLYSDNCVADGRRERRCPNPLPLSSASIVTHVASRTAQHREERYHSAGMYHSAGTLPFGRDVTI
jgi:hypothetical protein